MRYFEIIFLICLIAIPGCGGEKHEHVSTNTIFVYTSNRAIQCGSDGLSIGNTANMLIETGVDVLVSHCGITTGLDIPSVCGAGTSSINIHEIYVQNIVDAEILEFYPVDNLVNRELGLDYEVVSCED